MLRASLLLLASAVLTTPSVLAIEYPNQTRVRRFTEPKVVVLNTVSMVEAEDEDQRFDFNLMLVHREIIQVRLKQGLVIGVTDQWSSERNWYKKQKTVVRAFYNIPYAEPPTGLLRFKDPVEKDKWSGLWDSTDQERGELVQCVQMKPRRGGVSEVVGQEDCLYLSVYTPSMPIVPENVTKEDLKNLKKPELRPVIVYIHGGSFMYGSQHPYNPRVLVTDHKIVFVKFNYRLGPFGFLSTGDSQVPGNMGLRDQIMALKWVQENIEKFGGDPNCVTLAGSYAGAASVHFHMLSKHSKGLFHRAYTISGTMLSPWAIAENLPEKTKIIAEFVGCLDSDSKIMVDCLRDRPATYLTDAVDLTMPFLNHPVSPWGPSLDKFAEDPLIPNYPGIIMSEGSGTEVPWLVGVSNVEGLYAGAELLSESWIEKELNDHWPYYAPNILDYDDSMQQKLRMRFIIAEAIRYEYLKTATLDFNGKAKVKESNDATLYGEEDATLYVEANELSLLCSNKTTCKNFCEMIADRMFVVDAEKSARWMSKSVKAPVYFYVFNSFKDDVTIEDKNTFLLGAENLDDYHNPIQFNQKIKEPTPAENEVIDFVNDFIVGPTKGEDPDPYIEVKKTIEFMNELLASFAQTGKPHLMNWPKVTPDTFSYMEIENWESYKPVHNVTELGRRAFWDSLPFLEFNIYPNASETVSYFDPSRAELEMQAVVEKAKTNLCKWRANNQNGMVL